MDTRPCYREKHTQVRDPTPSLWRYVNSARTYFDSIDLPVEIIPLYGSVELGPITGMSEAIVDLVSTGRTLKENGLIEIEVLYHSTARLIAHPLSYRTEFSEFVTLLDKLRSNLPI